MKINNTFAETLRLAGMTANRDRDPAGNQHHRQEPGKERAPRDEKPAEAAPTETVQVTEEKIRKAVEAFGTEAHTQSNGLVASLSGEGPGLRIVLKDAQGNRLRQYTGEEFVKLREQASPSAKQPAARGRLLDQKF